MQFCFVFLMGCFIGNYIIPNENLVTKTALVEENGWAWNDVFSLERLENTQ